MTLRDSTTELHLADPPIRRDSRVTRWDDQGRVRCKRCGEYKSLTEYHTVPYKNRKGPQAYCKPCRRVYQTERNRVRMATDEDYRERARAASTAASRRHYAATRLEREQAAAERQKRHHERRLLTDWAIAACRANGMTLTTIAANLGIDLSQLSRWVNGHVTPRDHALDQLMDLAFDHGAVWKEEFE